MRIECGNYMMRKDAPMEVGRLMSLLGNKMQVATQRYDKRPYGVGLLIAGYSVSIYTNYIHTSFNLLNVKQHCCNI